MKLKVKLNRMFLEWFKQTNPHLYKKGITSLERSLEIEEYVNDVLHEHMEYMANYDLSEGEEEK